MRYESGTAVRRQALAVGRHAALMMMASALMACSVIATPTPIVFTDPLPDDPGPDTGGPALQREVFADGRVTFNEYERAMFAAIECMRDEGFNVEGPLRYPDGPLLLAPGIDPRHRLTLLARGVPPDPDDRFGGVNARCLAQWSYAIEQAYLRQFAPTPDEVRAWLERAWECLEEKGLPLSSPPTEQDATLSVLQGCRPWETG